MLSVKFLCEEEAAAIFGEDRAELGLTPISVCRPLLVAMPDELVEDEMLLVRFC